MWDDLFDGDGFLEEGDVLITDPEDLDVSVPENWDTGITPDVFATGNTQDIFSTKD